MEEIGDPNRGPLHVVQRVGSIFHLACWNARSKANFYKCVPFGLVAKQKRRNPLRNRRVSMVEMGGLEPPTPYMRSKCSTS